MPTRNAIPLFLLFLLLAGCATAQEQDGVRRELEGWQTNTARRSIELGELRSGGPPRDGIPALDAPRFVTPEAAAAWLQPQEPVVALTLGEVARAYPLQILTWHEIVNDVVDGTPVAVTFCPLCYSAIAFDRRVDGRTLTFGVSGMLRHSDMIMFDRQTESLWQQFTGEAVVGDLTGTRLRVLPAQILSFAQFRGAYPAGVVLSRETGHDRPYGRNPYAGYDDVSRTPFLYDGPTDDRLRPMEKVVAVTVDSASRAYPYALTATSRIVHDTLGGQPLVVFHADGAVTALGEAVIADGREVGSTGVFDPRVDDRSLHFAYEDGRFVDRETGSEWDVTGRALAGPLAGRQLRRLLHGDYFAFAWFAFRPESSIYGVR